MTGLSGKRVLVTAGGAGIGHAIASAFLGAGAKVMICDIDDAVLQAARSGFPELLTHKADVAEESEVDRLFDTLESELGGLDVMVNNAGVSGPTGPLETLSYEGWRRCVAVNLDAQFLCLRRAIPLLKTAGGGSVINISSSAGLFGYPLRSPYAAAKWAVIGLTKTLAMELGPHGIRVNAICPGSVSGPRMDRVIAAEAKARGVSEGEVRAGYVKQVSLRCFVEGRDIANMALFIASEAGAKISGQALSVDGNTETLAN